VGYEPKTLRIETSSPTTRPVGIFSLEVYPVKMAPEGFNFSNEGKKSEGAKDSSEKKSKDTKVSSGNVKHKLKCTQVKKRKVWKESPLVEKSQSKKKKITKQSLPKLNLQLLIANCNPQLWILQVLLQLDQARQILLLLLLLLPPIMSYMPYCNMFMPKLH
jgi:hypothetical protein